MTSIFAFEMRKNASLCNSLKDTTVDKPPYFLYVFKASPAVLRSWLTVHSQASLAIKVCPLFPFKDSPSASPSHCICSHKNMLKRFFP